MKTLQQLYNDPEIMILVASQAPTFCKLCKLPVSRLIQITPILVPYDPLYKPF